MSGLRRIGKRRRILLVLVGSLLVLADLTVGATAAGPGGWDHLGDGGTPGSTSLDGTVSALSATSSGFLYVGGNFTGAGGIADTSRIAKWSGTSWSAVSSPTSGINNGLVDAIAVDLNGNVYAGGTFQNAGGAVDADFLAKWNGTSWAPFCTSINPGSSFSGNVKALQIIGSTLYVGGEFQDGAGLADADYLLACDLTTGASSATTAPGSLLNPFQGPVYALTADGNGVLYAGGGFINLEQNAAADKVAYLSGGAWHAMGSGSGACGCAVGGFVRSLASIGPNVFVGTDATDVAGIVAADHVAQWDGTSWSALGANTAGTDGWFPTSATIDGLTTFSSLVFATGSFQDANGEARADSIAYFDGTWHPIGSDGAGNGALNPSGSAVAVFDQYRLDGTPLRIYAGGSFTTAGGDTQARGVASFRLVDLANPFDPVPPPIPTPPPAPIPLAPDTTAPNTVLAKSVINQAKHKATFKFASSEPSGARFLCKLDKTRFKLCASPKTYTKLKRGKHVFRVKARDRAGNVDATPTVKRFRIRR